MQHFLLALFIIISINLSLKSDKLKLDAYKIIIESCKNKKFAKDAIYKFPDTNSYVVKNGNWYVAQIDNIYSLKDAKKILNRVQKKYKSAYIKHYLINIEKANQVKKIKKSKTPILTDTNYQIEEKNTTITKVPKVEEVQNLQKDTIQDLQEEPNESSSEGLSLKDAISLSLKNSYKISSAKEKVIQARHKLREKIAAYYPKVDLYANAGGTYLKAYKKDEVKFLKSDESLVISQNIYAGGKHVNDVKQARENLKVALAKYRDKVEEESTKIIDAYLSVVFQKKAIKKAKENMRLLEKIVDIVSIKEKNGASSKGDLNYIMSQIQNAKSALIDVESKYKNALSYYEYFVGDLNESKMPIYQEYDIALKDIDEVLEKSYLNNAKIVAAIAKLNAQHYALKAQKSKFLPKLDLTITGKDKQSGYVGEPQEDRAKAILQLKYNLYNGGKDEAQRLELKSKIRELRYSLTDIKKGLKHNTEQLYESVNSNKEKLSHTLDELNSNKKVVDSYWNAFKYGTQDIQALILAQRALNRSELDVLKQKQSYTLSYFKLLQQTGELLESLGIDSL